MSRRSFTARKSIIANDARVGNIKLVWELGRHQHLIPLAVAYACSGDTRYRDAVTQQIEGWIKANPFGLGVHWCSALEVALRLTAWAVIHALLALRDGSDGLFIAVKTARTLAAQPVSAVVVCQAFSLAPFIG